MFKKVQFFESNKKKGSIGWVIFGKEFNFLSFFFSHIQKMGSILWVIFKKKERFNSMSHLKSSTLWVILKSGSWRSSILWVIYRVQFFASYSKKKGSILCVVLKEKGDNPLRRSQSKGSILCVILEKQGHFFESWKKWVQLFESCWKKNFNSLSHTEKRFIKRGSILWVISKEFNSLSNFLKKKKKSSILWLFFFDTRFNSSSHISTRNFNSLSDFLKRFNSLSQFFGEKQFFESLFKKGFNSLGHIQKRFNSVSDLKKGFKSLRHLEKEGSILWVIFSKKKSILWVRFGQRILDFGSRKRLGLISRKSSRR